MDSRAFTRINPGSDHYAAGLTLKVVRRRRRHFVLKHHEVQKGLTQEDNGADAASVTSQIDGNNTDMQMINDLQAKLHFSCSKIERALANAASTSIAMGKAVETPSTRNELTKLMGQMRQARQVGATRDVTKLSKLIQNENRAIPRAKR